MSEVGEITVPNPAGACLSELATRAAALAASVKATKLAIVAPEKLAFGLGRMYQTYWELQPGSTRQIGVFRTLPDALAFLGIETLEGPGTAKKAGSQM